MLIITLYTFISCYAKDDEDRTDSSFFLTPVLTHSIFNVWLRPISEAMQKDTDLSTCKHFFNIISLSEGNFI